MSHTMAEHMGVTPGLATPVCGACKSVDSYLAAKPLCMEYDRVLSVNANNKPIRCAECLAGARSGLND